MARIELDSIPKNLFEWSDLFNDDLGFEPISLGAPTDSAPGSPEKIAAIDERLARGQSLWHPDDARDDDFVIGESLERDLFTVDTYQVAGSGKYGAVVGKDRSGAKHRYALWCKLPNMKPRPLKVLYVTEGCGYVDSFDLDSELSAIRRHAKLHGAGFVSVVPLFSARARDASELRNADYPVTGIGLLWARWLAKYCDRVVACWGKTTRLERNVDVLWMLSRTARGGHVYTTSEDATYPEKMAVQSFGMHRWDYKRLISDREMEESDDDIEQSPDSGSVESSEDT